MIQLKVYNDSSQTEQTFLDLYETSPIKLNLSIEDITTAEARSVFSRTFRVPGTRTNQQYFKHAFLINGVDFDVTQKKPAEILVDGAEFRQGHIRLQKIFMNADQDKIDYEVLFLGETRDFSSAIGDAAMCNLQMPDLQHTQSYQNVETSWLAYPQSTSFTAGLADGNVLYPLIDFGNSYDNDGDVEQPKIGLGNSSSTNRYFNHTGNPIEVDRFRPMIRARRLVGQIFDDAGYTFTSSFLDSDLFRSIYVSAFGNEAVVAINVNETSINTGEVSGNITQAEGDLLRADTVISDIGQNFTLQDLFGGTSYEAPAAGVYGVRAEAYVTAQRELSQGFDDIAMRLVISNASQTTTYATGSYVTNGIATVQANVTLAQGDKIYIYAEPQVSVDQSIVNNFNFQILSAPGDVNPASMLDCEYKQIDFIKDVLTTFRLVMAPDPTDPKNFIIEPFVNYITQGELHNWSDKLVEEKDFIIEPLFYTQSDLIKFKHETDADVLNLYHEKAYKQSYGYLEFDSGNELLKGTRDIKTEWAPTPITQIDFQDQQSFSQRFVIPKIHANETDQGLTQHQPIKPKTRFLFYNGLQTVGTIGASAHDAEWYMVGSPNSPFDTYPLVSYYEDWPPTADSVVLNWNTDIAYYGTSTPYNVSSDNDLYRIYWSSYINSLYSSQARRVTAYFILNNVDLQDFSFDDIIFVNGTYYRPEKIIDAEIGNKGPVRVQLIKLLDYGPRSQTGGALTVNTSTTAPGCYNGNDGEVDVDITETVTVPLSWSLTNGDTGTAQSEPFTITGLNPGTYTITVTDSSGATGQSQFTVAQSNATELGATSNVTAPSDCEPQTNDGSVTITATGGTSPYTISWDDGGPASFTRSNLTSAYYDFTITDANGCTFDSTVLVSCTTVQNNNNITVYEEEWQYEVQGTVDEIAPFVVLYVSSGTQAGWYAYDGTWQDLLNIAQGNGGLIPVAWQNGTTCDYNRDWFKASTYGALLEVPFEDTGCFQGQNAQQNSRVTRNASSVTFAIE